MKILFLTLRAGSAPTGGLQCSNRNLNCLKELIGKDKVDIYYPEPIAPQVESRFSRIMNTVRKIISGYMGGYSKRQVKILIDKIAQENINTLFLDGSIFGQVAKKLKKRYPYLQIITFFHNIEYLLYKDLYKRTRRKGLLPNAWLAYRNERKSCRLSDKIILLNERDSQACLKYYKRKADGLIPITMDDTYEETDAPQPNGQKMTGLFVGSYFPGNTLGLKWFCEQVLPRTNIRLIITGSGMARFKNDIPEVDESLYEIHENVPDLAPFYREADFVVLPISAGGGMKVKTAEAFMHGKYVIGTEEAFCGYLINDEYACLCNTAEDFIKAINGFDRSRIPRSREAARKYFKQYHSSRVALERFNSFIHGQANADNCHTGI